MFTDIVGYTALMSKDEQKALRILHKNRDIQKPLVAEFNGEWLEKGYDMRAGLWMAHLKLFFIFDLLRGDPRFKALLNTINLDD